MMPTKRANSKRIRPEDYASWLARTRRSDGISQAQVILIYDSAMLSAASLPKTTALPTDVPDM